MCCQSFNPSFRMTLPDQHQEAMFGREKIRLATQAGSSRAHLSLASCPKSLSRPNQSSLTSHHPLIGRQKHQIRVGPPILEALTNNTSEHGSMMNTRKSHPHHKAHRAHCSLSHQRSGSRPNVNLLGQRRKIVRSCLHFSE